MGKYVTCSIYCNYRIAANLHLRYMVCFSYIIVNMLYKCKRN